PPLHQPLSGRRVRRAAFRREPLMALPPARQTGVLAGFWPLYLLFGDVAAITRRRRAARRISSGDVGLQLEEGEQPGEVGTSGLRGMPGSPEDGVLGGIEAERHVEAHAEVAIQEVLDAGGHRSDQRRTVPLVARIDAPLPPPLLDPPRGALVVPHQIGRPRARRDERDETAL